MPITQLQSLLRATAKEAEKRVKELTKNNEMTREEIKQKISAFHSGQMAVKNPRMNTVITKDSHPPVKGKVVRADDLPAEMVENEPDEFTAPPKEPEPEYKLGDHTRNLFRGRKDE